MLYGLLLTSVTCAFLWKVHYLRCCLFGVWIGNCHEKTLLWHSPWRAWKLFGDYCIMQLVDPEWMMSRGDWHI